MRLTKTKLNFFFPVLALLFISSCKNASNNIIPFPAQESEYQFTSESLKFSDTLTVKWDTSKFGHVKPLIKKFDLNKLPSGYYDTTGYKPFLKPPEEVPFNWNSLPTKSFSLASIPAKPLTFKTSFISPPKIIKAGPLRLVKSGILEFGNEQGLAGDGFSALLKDPNGTVWIKSNKGLYQYDGENLRLYSVPILGNTTLSEDNSGNIWIGSDMGLVVLNFREGIFKSLNTDNAISFRNGNIWRILNDKQGNMWVSTFNNGVYIIDPIAGIIRNFTTGKGLSSDTTTDLITDNNGSVWIGTSKGINIVNLKDGKIKYLGQAQGLAYNFIISMTLDRMNRVLVSTNKKMNINRSQGELNIIDVKGANIKHLGWTQGLDSTSAISLR